MNTSRTLKARAFITFMAIACLGTVAIGLSVIESPATMRLKKTDERRINDLKEIIQAASDIHDQDGTAPERLEDLIAQSNDRLDSTDPVTGTHYEYRRLPESRIEVCAIFSASNEIRGNSDTIYFNKNWRNLFHDVGRHCFEFNLQDEN